MDVCASAQEPITTDLRRWFDQHMKLMADDELREGFGNLCDAIDAVQANLERENARMMELPRDADGEPIHIGDVIITPEGHEDVVEGILPDRVLVLRDDKWLTVRTVWCHHHVPDTWERIIEDAWNGRDSGKNLVARCRALAGEARVARCRALAGEAR